MTDGSWVYPIFACYAAAVDALTMRVRVVDIGISRASVQDIRAIIDAQRPDEIVWCSSRAPLFDGPFTRFEHKGYAEPVFPVLDRWQADHYAIRHAPGCNGWQLQIHALPLGAEWFGDYIADLRNRFPAYSCAVVFGLELCAYQTEAIETLAGLGVSWSCAAGEKLLHRTGETIAAGCCGYIVDVETVPLESIVAAKLRGMQIHGRGPSPKAALTIPVDSFTAYQTEAA